MFRVERKDLVDRIWTLSGSGSVLLSGSPGTGKSWTIGQFIRYCQSMRRPMVSIAAEDFEVKSLSELDSALGFKRGIISALGSIGVNPVLVIDGLDALRGESSQRVFRQLIQLTGREVPQCSIVASIRTFDLQQSEELQDLFFSVASGVHPRFAHVVIEPFSDLELEFVNKQVQGLEDLIRNASPELRELLHNAFNLHIASQLLNDGAVVGELAAVHSQVQLLGKYWNHRVESSPDAGDRKAVLRKVVEGMVERATLSISEGEVYSKGTTEVFAELLSLEVLRRSSTDRISFTHNILFDYAVARLLVDEERVFTFIEGDSARTIFFRPSLSFFFHHLWWKDRDLFWDLAFAFFDKPRLPARARVIPAVVITEAARDINDLQPLLASEKRSPTAVTFTLRAAHAIGSLQSPSRQLWLAAMEQLSTSLALEFVNEYVSLLGIARTGIRPQEETIIGLIARRLLTWMWKEAETLSIPQAVKLNTVAIARVFPVAMEVYQSDPSASKYLVRRILARFRSPRSSSNEAFWLAHEMRTIIERDPRLASIVYAKMFSHREQSEERTEMGGSLVLSMTSTRRQDFESGLYGLATVFQTFVDRSPMWAAFAAVSAVNAEVRSEHPLSDEDSCASFSFSYLGRRSIYVPDYSEIWDHGAREYQSLQLLNSVLNAAAALPEPVAIIRAVAHHARVAVCWKRILEIAAGHVELFYEPVRELLFIPAFISAPEVSVSAGNVIQAAFKSSLVSTDDQQRLEEAIISIGSTEIIKRYEKPESIQNRLLLCIGKDRLLTEELRTRAKAIEEERFQNEPYQQIHVSHRSFSTEDWLREQGVDTAAAENASVLAVVKEVAEFENRFLNKQPTQEECEAILPKLQRLDEMVRSDTANEAVSEQARGTLCAAAETVLKNYELPEDHPAVALSRDVVLRGVSDPSPVFDPKYHASFDMPSWGSPSPRIEAAQGVTHLLWNYGPKEDVVKALETLADDSVPAVRFQVASGLLGFYKHKDYERFWSAVDTMMKLENTPGVMLGLLETLGRVAGQDPERVVSLLRAAIERGLPSSSRFEMTRALVQILTGLYIMRDNQSAGEQLSRFENSPIEFQREIGDEVFTASAYLHPSVAGKEARLRAVSLYIRVLNATYSRLDDTEKEPDSQEKGETILQLLKHIDEVASRVFFALDVDDKLRNGKPGLTDGTRAELYGELKPVIEKLAQGPQKAPHRLLPHTAHYLLQTLNGILRYDPENVIRFGASICTAGSHLSYQFDQMAISEVVKLVETALADHKDILRKHEAADAVGIILDTFVQAGWPEAMQLTFRLDQVIR